MRHIEDKQWWEERLDAWSHEGFNVDSFADALRAEPAKSSELLMQFEKTVSANRSLRHRVLESKMSREDKSRWLSNLEEIENTDSMLEQWKEEASINRPWEPYVNRAKEKWLEKEKGEELDTIVKRLSSLDPSSHSACQPLLILFDDVDSESLISSMLEDIEKDESRRRNVVNEMITLLDKDGIDASEARKLTINDALEHLTSLQSKAKDARSTRLKIEKEIRPYDDELAKRLLEKKSEGLEEEVDAIIKNLSERIVSLNSTVDEWKRLGVIFPDGGEVNPENLLDWESGLPEIEKAVEIHLRALERWNDFATLWPDRCTDSALVGRLDMTEEFVDLVDSLDQEWRELELEGMEIIGSWEDKGFAMEIWRSRLSQEPRSTISWLKREENRYTTANSLIESLLALDASISGEEEIARRVAILREFELDNDLLEEMEIFISSKGSRTARHRSMLEREWMELLRKGIVEDRSTSSLSLSEFESLIADSRRKKRTSGIPIDRLKIRMQNVIDEWYEMGFSVDDLSAMLINDPYALAMRIASIREAVSKHEQLRRRVSKLDWTRDPELAGSINLDLSRPDRLESLTNDLPNIIAELSKKKVADKDYKFVAWRPKARDVPVSVPVPRDNIGDAMEAILEDMDTNDNDQESTDLETDEKVPVADDSLAIQNKKPEDEKGQQNIGPESPVEEDDSASERIEDQATKINPEVVADKKVTKRPPRDESPDKESIEAPKKVSGDGISALASLLRSLGLSQDADLLLDNGDQNLVRRLLASHVGKEPRDMRIDRLLRLSLRLMPKGDENDLRRLELISILTDLAIELSKWTRTRLEARHSGSVGDLLEDSATLGKALNRIPGPGTALPLSADDYSLPQLDDLDGLSKEVKILERRVLLSSAGGVR